MSRRRKQSSRRPRQPRPGGRGGAGFGGAADGTWRPFDDASSSTRGEPGPDGRGADEAAFVRRLFENVGARVLPMEAARRLAAGVPSHRLVDFGGPHLGERLATAWASGWQPAELVWHVNRVGGGEAAAVLTALVAADALTVAAHEIHPEWRAQLTELGASVTDRPAPLDPGWLSASARAGSPDDTASAALVLASVLGRLPRVETLLPPPGRPDLELAVAAPPVDFEALGLDPRLLERVRALLAKAESTTFEAEAQAFTAKAQELMTRHSLQHAMVVGRGATAAERPMARRVTIDDPYAGAKAHLLHVIAEASRCQAVSLGGLQMSTIVGFESDLDGVEVLFTSLLVQAQSALGALARRSPPGSRERSRGFRSSFLSGFSVRIGERLVEARDRTTAEVDRESGGALVPVVAARESEVDDQVSALFPTLRRTRRTGSVDTLGWRAGTSEADRTEMPWARLPS